VIHAAWAHGTRKLLFLGSSGIYPRIAGLKMCQAYRRQHGFDAISAMPTNLYGPGDHFDPMNSHVLPALMRRFHEAKLAGAPEVVVWGTGTPRKLLEVGRLRALGWQPTIPLEAGLRTTYEWFLANQGRLRGS
jgi:GDP-L-fucose synthase